MKTANRALSLILAAAAASLAGCGNTSDDVAPTTTDTEAAEETTSDRIDSLPADLDEVNRKVMQLEIEREALRRETDEASRERLEKLEEVASSFEGVERCFAIQAGREVRIMVRPEIVNDDKMILLARDICRKIESDLEYPGQIKVTIMRESRAIEYAK